MKYCSQCGKEMDIALRSVIYRSRVKILNVPIHVCKDEECACTSVVDLVKDDLKQLMRNLGDQPEEQEVAFEAISEFANLLVIIAEQSEDEELKDKIDERVNELLDLYLLAKSLHAQQWISEIQRKLTQIKLEV
ncbi:hypothetical protein EEL32_18695 [Brevibacillus laterosporus]|uniref:Uncharacterized protein n=1 Tax=Brevibacillus laterosporus TaxID=1465 RepID=A0A502I9H7_BRELA|nr:hypothetical protein [Brevibacillus laterosporus]QDX91131.1 hypothetical protein EEL30_01225 [Brevibacillus laterosporus]QDX95629.1 hypothetical protein EEL30_27260 [Brevibacillus laterosporus]RAP28061.1 hypothetical protein C2W64_00527 [Brevibacillus laterosporus]TPG69537.1 hypothetical protein EEL31_14185 [Brevibacillus laterosporus]TPG82965.1 hypothetical protein EEL32_18695 [Brevibacillus laterosporus]